LRKILYSAELGPTAIAEVFQKTRTIDRTKDIPWIVAFEITRSVKLLCLRRTWPTRAGASMAINSGPRPRARRWSQIIYEAYPEAEGLWYSSSMHGDNPAAAFYERAISSLPQFPILHKPLSDPGLLTLLQNVAFDLTYGLV
jgi:hypothetical protein